MAMWQPDGGARTRIGVLTPYADVWPEAEFGAMAPNGISIHAMRVPFGAYKPGGVMDRTIADDPVRAYPIDAATPSCFNIRKALLTKRRWFNGGCFHAWR